MKDEFSRGKATRRHAARPQPASSTLVGICLALFASCTDPGLKPTSFSVPPEGAQTGSSGPARHPSTAASTLPTSQVYRLEERFQSARTPDDHVDAMVFWWGGGGQPWLIASAKTGDHINVYDAASGGLVRQVGKTGSSREEFARPHDLAVIEDLLLVLERDNSRVQILRLPSLRSLGWFGDDVLERPYGIAALRPGSGGGYDVYVGDNYDSSPAGRDLDERIKHFRLRVTGERIEADLLARFGMTSGDGALFKVETLVADPGLERLLIAEGTLGTIKVYSLDGEYQQTITGRLGNAYLPEAITLFECSGDGYYVTGEDEFTVSMFQVFERRSLEPIGAFVGTSTTNSDGLVAVRARLPNFPEGAVFAVNNDESVVGFSWADIAAAMSLKGGCAASPSPGHRGSSSES